MPKRVKLGLAQPRSPVELETELGLARGQVQSLTLHADGDVEVTLADSVPWPDQVLRDKLEKAYNKKLRS